ncbi:MAG: sensor domain-containing diguanylate cyclase [Oceanococcus sp.]
MSVDKPAVDIDEFPCGCLVTDANWNILELNEYLTTTLGWPKSDLLGAPLRSIFSLASKMFFDSYALPMLVHENRCDEIQLTVKTFADASVCIPMVVNGRWAGGESDLVYWSFFTANNRDKLYQELLNTRERLEELNENLSNLAITDELTKLLNRRELERRAAMEFERAKRVGGHLSVLMLDIDFFKAVNDKYGHAEGDTVLRELGSVLASCARTVDVVARYGGEEFMLVLPDTDRKQAVELASRIHQLLRTIESQAGAITASMGVSTFSGEPTLSLSEVFEQADSALYHAKETGRNQTAAFPYSH